MSRFAAVATACLLTSVALPALAQSFNARPGAWEITTTIGGDVLSASALAGMSPDRRAAAEKSLASQTGAGHAMTRRTCVSQADLDRNSFAQNTGAGCTAKQVSRTSNRIVLETTCTGPPASSGNATFESKVPEALIGAIDQKRADGSKLHIDIVGKWLGASCEGIPARGSAR